MEKSIFKVTLFILGVMLFTGGACPSNDTTASNKVAQSEIFQSYSVSESGTNYVITAFFRIGGKTGTTLALSPPSKVTFNGKPMVERPNTTSGTFYTIEVPNSTTAGAFAFTDRDGKTYSNAIDLSRAELVNKNVKIDSSATVALPLTGAILDSANFDLKLNEHMAFVGPSDSSMSDAYYDKSKNAVIIAPSAWKDVPGGIVKVELTVRNYTAVQQGTALGGDMSFSYLSAPLTVGLVKTASRSTRQMANSTSGAGKSTAGRK